MIPVVALGPESAIARAVTQWIEEAVTQFGGQRHALGYFLSARPGKATNGRALMRVTLESEVVPTEAVPRGR